MVTPESKDHFSLRWNNYHNNLSTGFHSLLQAEDLVDVTLAVDGNFIQAHKIVLSICSPYFKTLFKVNPCQHPIVILKDVSLRELTGILEFMYKGEVSINQDDLSMFLKTAEMLQIKGLTGDDNSEQKNDTVPQPTTSSKRTKLINKPNKSTVSPKKTPKPDIVDTLKISEPILKKQNNDISTKMIEEPVANSPNENIISDNCELINRLHQPVLGSTKIEPIDFDDDPMDEDSFDDSHMHSYSKTGLNLDDSSVSQPYSLAKSASNIFLLSEQPSESTSNSLPASLIGNDEKGEGNSIRGVICPYCQKRFSTKGNLTVHVRDRHTKSEIHFVCPLCSKRSKNQGSLRVHIYQAHTRPEKSPGSESRSSSNRTFQFT